MSNVTRASGVSRTKAQEERKSIFFGLLVLAIAATRAALGAADSLPGPEAAQRLVGRALGWTPLLEDVRELCDQVGGRPTGSPACTRAVAWAVAKFETAGLDTVWTESFSVPTF